MTSDLRPPHLLSVVESLHSSQDQTLLLRQHVHILDAIFKVLPWLQEKRALTLTETKKKSKH